MRLHPTRELDDGVVESHLTVDGIPGILWTPSSADRTSPVPLVLMGHPGGIDQMYPRLAARARSCAAHGLASATIELPGSGTRPASASADQARAELRQVVAAGGRPSEEVVDRLVLPLTDQAVPEWQQTLDALLDLPEIGERIGFSGGVVAIGIRLAAVEPRLSAVSLFAGTFVPRAILQDAARVTVPAHMLLQWDDADNDRQRSLELFDALASREKTLLANMGGHSGVPASAGEEVVRFLGRHLT